MPSSDSAEEMWNCAMLRRLEVVLKICKARIAEPGYRAVIAEIAPHLQHKPTYYDMSLGLDSNAKYMEMHTPGIIEGGRRILEIGPGMGAWAMLARELRNEYHGIDLIIPPAPPESNDGTRRRMAYTWCYSRATRSVGLNIEYTGFHRYIADDNPYWPHGFKCYDFIHSRGSLSGLIHSAGGVDAIKTTARRLLDLWGRLLAQGGEVYISHNQGRRAEAWCAAVARDPRGFEVAVNTAAVCRLVMP